MPNNLSGQFDLVGAIEGTALPGNTDVASFTDNSGLPSTDYTATIDWGDGVTTIGTVVGSGGNFTVEGGHTYADDDFFNPVATITRTTDNAQLQLFGGVNVSDADNLTGHSAATLVANPNQALTNVVVATFTDTYTGHADASDFSVNIDWGDGTVTAGTATGSGGSFTVSGSHTYASAGNFTITTFFNDDSPDASFASATTQADIGFGGTELFSAANETVAVPAGTTVATFADNAGLTATDYTATIDWGDGTTTVGMVSGSGPSFTVTSAVAHTYADEGLFTEVVTITRTTDSATIAPSGTVTVFDTDNLSASGTTLSGSPGVAFNNVTVATFTDSNTANGAGDFTATVDWGDGTTTAGTISGSGGSFTVNGSHTYAQNGQDTIQVFIAEDASDGQGTASASAISTANIGVAPGSGSSLSATEGTAIPANTQVATFTDANNTDTPLSFTASIDWGDGATTSGTVVGALGSFTVFGGPHTYADEGLDAVTTTVTRTADNETVTMTGQATVAEADVLSVTGDNISGSQGTPINNAQVATFTTTYTGNVAADFTATIDWGDGTTTAGTIAGSNGSFTVDGSHTYTAPGTDQLKVRVDDFVFATASGTATATIAARTLTGTMVLSAATEATALSNTTTVATFTDSVSSDMASDFSATINWGDGVTTAGTVVGSNGSFTVKGGHTYADEGSDPASVTLTHTADSAQATASGTVSVGEADVLAGHGTKIKANIHHAFSGVVATFSDTDTANVAGDFNATINWGDGTTTSGTVSGGSGTFAVSGTHQYAHPGHENVTVTLNDDAPGTATATAQSTANVSSDAKNDFNGDTKSDLLLQRNPNSAHPDVMVELLSGQSISFSGTTPETKGWHVVAAGDFNVDGDSDIVLQNTDGTPQIWLMNGTSVTSAVTLANPGSAWHVIAAADFNGDGEPDLLFQNDNGTPMIWEMNGTSVTSTASLPNPGSSWHVIGAGDFNGDGNDDILFQNSDGTVTEWLMNGTSIVSAVAVGNPGGSFKAIGTGDFNGDGMSDILFQSNNGTPMIWEMNGTSILASATLSNPGAPFTAIGTSDFNGDGMADILFQRSNGPPLIWEMNGTSVVSSFTLTSPGPQWKLQDDGPIGSGQSATGSQQPTLRASTPDAASAALSAPGSYSLAPSLPVPLGRMPFSLPT
jgi:hypothetical protein